MALPCRFRSYIPDSGFKSWFFWILIFLTIGGFAWMLSTTIIGACEHGGFTKALSDDTCMNLAYAVGGSTMCVAHAVITIWEFHSTPKTPPSTEEKKELPYFFLSMCFLLCSVVPMIYGLSHFITPDINNACATHIPIFMLSFGSISAAGLIIACWLNLRPQHDTPTDDAFSNTEIVKQTDASCISPSPESLAKGDLSNSTTKDDSALKHGLRQQSNVTKKRSISYYLQPNRQYGRAPQPHQKTNTSSRLASMQVIPEQGPRRVQSQHRRSYSQLESRRYGRGHPIRQVDPHREQLAMPAVNTNTLQDAWNSCESERPVLVDNGTIGTIRPDPEQEVQYAIMRQAVHDCDSLGSSTSTSLSSYSSTASTSTESTSSSDTSSGSSFSTLSGSGSTSSYTTISGSTMTTNPSVI